MTFTEDVLHGRARPDQVDDYIDEWHDAAPDSPIAQRELHEHLGMTWEEYRRWAADPAALRYPGADT